MLKLKHSPNVIKSGPNRISSCSYKKYPKSHQSFWATLISTFFTMNVLKSPNLVTLMHIFLLCSVKVRCTYLVPECLGTLTSESEFSKI